jgi:hypothetical protein
MSTNHRPLAIYTTRGDVGAFLVYPHIYSVTGEWIGFVNAKRDVYSVMGVYVGTLAQPFRVLRKRSDDFMQPKMAPPSAPTKIYPPATVPLAPMMPELGFDTVDVLYEEPERLHPLDSGELREDME